MIWHDPNDSIVTESDVEQKLIYPLLTSTLLLNIPADNIKTKDYLAPTRLDKSAGKSVGYYPDYSIWFLGLPVLIVEAKAPGVDPAEGFREASLYARHFNQLYPSTINPCCRILATNGEAWLCGPWDSQPTLQFATGEMVPGAAKHDSLIDFCGRDSLEDLAQESSAKLRSRTHFIPSDELGGQPALNAKRPLNTFAAELTPLLRRYFSSTPQESIHEIAKKGYVSSNEITSYDKVLESLLKDRISLRQGMSTELQTSRRAEPTVAKAIRAFDKNRPLNGQLQIIQGAVGSGKSLFTRRYKDVLQAPADADRTKWAFIDFNESTMLDPTQAETWVYRAFISAFQAENPDFDLYSETIQQSIYSSNFQKRRAVYSHLEAAGPAAVAEHRAKDLAAWQDDAMITAVGLAQYLLNNKGYILVVVLDNVDRLDLKGQLLSFNVALSFMSSLRCFVILQLRDETYERFKDRPPLDTYRSGVTFHISPPRFVDVVKKRLELSLEYLTEHAEDKQQFTLESGIRISYPKTEIGTFLSQLYLELFERKHNISRVLEALAGNDIRRALEMFVSVITSGHLSATDIASQGIGGKPSIREHHVLNILMRTDYVFSSDNVGYTTNIFGFDKHCERPDNFLFVEILYYLF